MKHKIKCEDYIDCGKTMIRGWHDYTDCPRPAKFKITYKDGRVKMLCGIHKNKEVYRNQWEDKIEKIEEI